MRQRSRSVVLLRLADCLAAMHDVHCYQKQGWSQPTTTKS